MENQNEELNLLRQMVISLQPDGSADCSDVLPQQVRSTEELEELEHLLETAENRNKLVSNASDT